MLVIIRAYAVQSSEDQNALTFCQYVLHMTCFKT